MPTSFDRVTYFQTLAEANAIAANLGRWTETARVRQFYRYGRPAWAVQLHASGPYFGQDLGFEEATTHACPWCPVA